MSADAGRRADRLLTVDEIASWLQVKPRTIYQWVHEGYIPVIKLGSLVRFDQASITAWVKKRETLGRASKRLEVDID
ncbi:MAG: helix-turn-helix domain-containing protein [Elusimicrobiota bacterium]